MKRLRSVTLSAIAITMTTPVLSLEFANEEAAAAFFKEAERGLQIIQKNMEKGITDDAALKEAIRLIFEMDSIENPIVYTQALSKKLEVPDKRMTNILEAMIRDKLLAIEKEKAASVSLGVGELFPLLKTFPDYDMLPILKECALSKDGRIRQFTRQTAEKIITNLKEKDKTEDAARFTDFLNELKQAEQAKGIP